MAVPPNDRSTFAMLNIPPVLLDPITRLGFDPLMERITTFTYANRSLLLRRSFVSPVNRTMLCSRRHRWLTTEQRFEREWWMYISSLPSVRWNFSFFSSFLGEFSFLVLFKKWKGFDHIDPKSALLLDDGKNSKTVKSCLKMFWDSYALMMMMMIIIMTLGRSESNLPNQLRK